MAPASPEFRIEDYLLPPEPRRLTVREVLEILFFHPSALFILRRDRFARAFRLFAVV